MKPETYTLFVASNRRGTMRKVTVPFYALHVLAALAVVGGISVTAAVGSYTRMLWKVANYNALRSETETLRNRYQRLQTTVNQTNAQLASLQVLAQEVSLAYGIKEKLEGPNAATDRPLSTYTSSSSSPR